MLYSTSWIAYPKQAVVEGGPTNAAAKKAKEAKEAKDKKDAEEREKAYLESWKFYICGPDGFFGLCCAAEKFQTENKSDKKDLIVNTKKEQPENIIIVSDEDPLWVAMRYVLRPLL